MKTTLVPWFRPDSLPVLVDGRAIVVGGTSLLREFMAFVASSTGSGSLAIAAPFISRGIGHHISSWQAMHHESIDLSLVTQSEADAQAAVDGIGAHPWRSLEVWITPRLHAKIYAFVGENGQAACLVGSHNLTPAGARTNEEAGTLFVSNRFSEMHELIDACHDHVGRLGRHGRKFLDTLSWPSERLA